jgi:ketosteroid isomerase-like protein
VDAALPRDLSGFARAFFDAIVERRVEDIVGAYARDEQTLVFLEGPRWQTQGFERISTGWRAFADAPLDVESITWVDGPYGGVSDGSGWFAGTLELRVHARGRSTTVRWRDTHVLVKSDDGAWRIVHEHVSQPTADPYGIGDWVAT